jgi:CBS domain-containing protein
MATTTTYAPSAVPITADCVPVTRIMTRNVVCARPRLPVKALVRLMIRNHIGCVPIVDDRGHPRGMVTKSDLIELLDDGNALDADAQIAEDIMMPLAITLDENATVAHVASLMAIEGFHHVMIVGKSGALTGLVSSQDVVRWIADTEIRGPQ